MTPNSEKRNRERKPDAPERDDAVTSECDEYLQGLSELMSEWASPEDEEAWRDL